MTNGRAEEGSGGYHIRASDSEQNPNKVFRKNENDYFLLGNAFLDDFILVGGKGAPLRVDPAQA